MLKNTLDSTVCFCSWFKLNLAQISHYEKMFEVWKQMYGTARGVCDDHARKYELIRIIFY